MDQRLALRALLVALCDWVTAEVVPPPSQYPTLARGDLVAPSAVKFPQIPGVAVARIPAQPYRMDFGPRWKSGIIDLEPPRLGAPYVVLVPRVDEMGNDLGGIRSVELRVPLATYFPWHLRTGLSAPDRLISFTGTFVPLPRTEQERLASGDSRPSIEHLYSSREAFLTRVGQEAQALVRDRFMLADDVAEARHRMADTWDFVQGHTATEPTAGVSR